MIALFREQVMTPFQLARMHPRLWHLTAADAVQGILDRGLLTAEDIVARWDVDPAERHAYLTRRRPEPVTLAHPDLGSVVINDNAPLNERKLAAVLDDALTTSEWLRMLNSRVFFFADKTSLCSPVNAALNVGRPKRILEIDTRSLADAYGPSMEIVPINSGNTNYAAARRGLGTFAPLVPTDYARWQRQRGKKQPDTIKEVAVRCSIPDISRFVKAIHERVPA